jgi:hypothetical protein
MKRLRNYTLIIICAVSLIPEKAFSQYNLVPDSLFSNSVVIRKKPEFHYSAGSSFMYMPRFGSVSGVDFRPVLVYPVTGKLSVEAGLIAGHYFTSFKNSLLEQAIGGGYSSLSLFGSATYHVSPVLSFYGIGIKQLAGTNPMLNMYGNSFSIGSSLKLGNITLGAEFHVRDQYDFNPYPRFGGSHSYFPTYPW